MPGFSVLTSRLLLGRFPIEGISRESAAPSISSSGFPPAKLLASAV
jgi:hypothetical protein